MNKIPKKLKAKLIYNPNAGKKKQMVNLQDSVSLEDIKDLLDQYQIPVDYFPTKGPNHGRVLAREAKKEGYKMVIAAGGDGTVAEVATGLIGKEIPLAILPLGSVMNVARMLSIPRDLEEAVRTIKIGRVRKIDVGMITILDGLKLVKPQYFLEEAGVGLEAQIHYYLTGKFERGEKGNVLRIIKTLFENYRHPASVYLDDKEVETRALMLTVSNGPYGGAALKLAPKSKLNDHLLTVSLFRMNKLQMANYLIELLLQLKPTSPKIKTYQAKKVRVDTAVKRLVHADARVFGGTPVEFEIISNALDVVCGFPEEGKSSLRERKTYLNP